MKDKWTWSVYIIECKDGLYYTGMTSDLIKRMDQHMLGLGSEFTKKHGFNELKYHEEFSDIEQARIRERQLKDWSRSKKESLWNGHDSRLEHSPHSNDKKIRIRLLVHDIRSTHNVGAFFRTCDGLGIDSIIFSGYTPYPKFEGDTRLPHFADKITRQIHKTALGAETHVPFEQFDTVSSALESLNGSCIIALEQVPNSYSPGEVLTKLKSSEITDIVLAVGNEIHGVHPEILKHADYIMELPMHGSKESLNVSVATGIALYELAKLT